MTDRTELAAIRFKPAQMPELGSTAEWVAENLSIVRLAWAIVGKTEDELEAFTRELVTSKEDGAECLAAFLDELKRVSEYLRGVREVVQNAEFAVMITAKRIVQEG